MKLNLTDDGTIDEKKVEKTILLVSTWTMWRCAAVNII